MLTVLTLAAAGIILHAPDNMEDIGDVLMTDSAGQVHAWAFVPGETATIGRFYGDFWVTFSDGSNLPEHFTFAGPMDFDQDGNTDWGSDANIEAFFNAFGRGEADWNNDGRVDDQDIVAFFGCLAGRCQ